MSIHSTRCLLNSEIMSGGAESFFTSLDKMLSE